MVTDFKWFFQLNFKKIFLAGIFSSHISDVNILKPLCLVVQYAKI